MIRFFTKTFVQASVAQLDARPIGDEEVVGSTPAVLATFFRGDLIMKYFLRPFSTFRWFKTGSCQFLVKELFILVLHIYTYMTYYNCFITKPSYI